MEKISSIIAIVAIICFISGGFAFIINDSSIEDINTNAISKTNDIMIDDENNLINLDNNLMENKEVIDDVIESKITPETKAVNTTNDKSTFYDSEFYRLNGSWLFLRKSVDYTDRYGICLGCGRIILLGEVTKPLPDYYKYCNLSSHMGGCADLDNTYPYEVIINDYDQYINRDTGDLNSEPPSSTDNIETPNNPDNKNPSDFTENNGADQIIYPTIRPSDVNFG